MGLDCAKQKGDSEIRVALVQASIEVWTASANKPALQCILK